MARSDYIGDRCNACRKIWKSQDFERTEIVEGDYLNESDGIMYEGQFWKIRCNLCGKMGLYLYFANPK